MKTLIIIAAALALTACDKYGAGGSFNQAFGNWAEVKMPDGCAPVQIAAESGSGVVVLCKDGRLFH